MSALVVVSAGKLFGASRKAIGAQLYTVREQAEKDLPGTLKAIHDIGYPEIETYAGVYKNRSAAELRKLITDNGLIAPSGHFDYETFDARMDYAKELGVDYMVCSMLPRTMWNPDGFKKAAQQFNSWGEALQLRGMKFAFHNHNYEFQKFGIQTGFDTLMASTNPKLVSFEVDCYWAAEAGRDPVSLLEEYPDRIRMLHLKDRKRGFATSQTLDDAAKHFAEVGNGTLHWRAILSLAAKNKIDYMFVEQDKTERPPLESLKISFDNLQKLTA